MSRGRSWLVAVLAVLLALCAPRSSDARKFLDAIGAADRAILKDLYDGRIVHAERFSAQLNTGSLWKVKIEHEGRTRWAIFKPREYGDRDGWGRSPMEVAIYKLNRILGMDMVPPTAYKRNLTLGGTHFAEGALVHWVDGAHSLRGVASRLWSPSKEAFSSDLRVLQMIGRDADHENGKNIVRGKHWKDGKWRVMKLDNEACGRRGARVELGYSSATWGPITRFNEQTYQRLKELNFRHLKMDMNGLLSDGEIREWIAARDRIVAHVDQQVRERGRQAVFFRPQEVAFDARRNVGRRASSALLAKFERLMSAKGATVQYLSPRDRRLGGAKGRTVLDASGKIVVLIARARRQAPRVGTLVEEQVHVNQLLRMAGQAGGLKRLRARLLPKTRANQAVRASMELYAKGLVGATAARSARDKRIVRSAKRRQARAAVFWGASARGARSLWSSAFKARRSR